ncbi:MAG: ABC transporter ATP-binding protein [Rhodocyclaceae bacterium]|nr:ABC transporter ATP-binding protein [Rhodocyclaceae bacterium]
MSSDIAIRATDLGKTYRMYAHPLNRLRQLVFPGGRKHYTEFHALQDVNFEIRKGETVGIIGRNGSGKSTLLQLICGILKPTTGSVEVNGRVSALLELGAGFHPEFTGRENVYMQGAIMGLTRAEMDARFDDIAAFADIGEFIEQPVKTYSSGMFVRLAFAVAVSVEPDILVVDEALAVGDAGFQAKCFRRMERLQAAATTILLVSHATEQMRRLSNSVMMLNLGRMVEYGLTGDVINHYLDSSSKTGAGAPSRDQRRENIDLSDFNFDDAKDRFAQRPAYNSDEFRWGDRSAEFLDFSLRADGKDHVWRIESGSVELCVLMKILFNRDVSRPVFGMVIRSKEGVMLFGVNSTGLDEIAVPRKKSELVCIQFAVTPHLGPGDYFVSVGVVDATDHAMVPLDRRYDSICLKVTGATPQLGVVDMEPSIRVLSSGILCVI